MSKSVVLLWEVTYILLLIISVRVKCIYSFVVELMIYDVVDIGYALYQMPFNIWEILVNLPMCISDGIKSIFLQNSWYSLFQKTIHLFLLLLLASDSVWKRLSRIVKYIQTDQRNHKLSQYISWIMIRQRLSNESGLETDRVWTAWLFSFTQHQWSSLCLV